jgi:leader peptidase (prepilin peptidase)/N-methyltransferase
VLYLLAIVIYRRDDALGMGDVKLAFLVGLMAVWPRALTAILFATMVGAVFGLILMLRARSGRATMPYGTALALGAFASFLLPGIS